MPEIVVAGGDDPGNLGTIGTRHTSRPRRDRLQQSTSMGMRHTSRPQRGRLQQSRTIGTRHTSLNAAGYMVGDNHLREKQFES
jgi:hypothetical protein